MTIVPLKLSAAITAVAVITSACTAPTLGPQIKDARVILDATVKETGPSLRAEVLKERNTAERLAADNRDVLLSLPTGCLARISVDLRNDVSNCRLISHASPPESPVSATQVQLALTFMADYFAVLQDLASEESAAGVKASASSLVTALGQFKASGSTQALSSLSRQVERNGPVFVASAGFVANQYRITALRKIMRQADPVLEELVRGIHPVLLDLGDPISDRRDAVIEATGRLDLARTSGTVNQQINAAAALRRSVAEMHVAEAKSPIRHLYLVRDLHGAMLARLNGNPSLDELTALTNTLSEIANLLEKR